MEYNKLNINSKKAWFIARAIPTIIISAILIGGDYYLTKKGDFFNDTSSLLANIAIGVIIFLMLLNTIVYPSLEYKQWRYIITKDKIEFSEGIYWISTVVIPIVRVQHIKINQGPINRKFNLANLHIYTAGGSYRIPNIEMKKAEEISDFLKDKVKEKVTENDR
ncbi:PH domain-containing protein [Clostridium cellulovorans]|uniref:Membrane-flanked domain n=1 Tax=Clostridium cellulovorans (strain ATCC 35296 / DSM 3052 / OCM 3 / 743B) TaxID=573061 RepID=D9SV39_CLOC7|nr:PH domain-containing protein [Clostridium cellulovorans]ADL53013.1 membrane-flanked domain [Clostridium cellulovorans 743B]